MAELKILPLLFSGGFYFIMIVKKQPKQHIFLLEYFFAHAIHYRCKRNQITPDTVEPSGNFKKTPTYGEQLWGKIRDLPRGFCHGDVYSGNIHKTPDGKLYLLDFDTSCDGFPMYDLTLICDITDYFHFDERNFYKSKKVLSRFIPEYTKYRPLSQAEIDAFYDLIAVQHFSTQATVMEVFGHDCLNDSELDYQLEWLYRWREQCENEAGI